MYKIMEKVFYNQNIFKLIKIYERWEYEENIFGDLRKSHLREKQFLKVLFDLTAASKTVSHDILIQPV